MKGDQIDPPGKNYLKKAQPYISMCYEQYLTENLREKTEKEKQLQQKRLSNQRVTEVKAKQAWFVQEVAKDTSEIDAEISRLAFFINEA